MKVRWTRNSVRLRITPSELAALGRGDPVCEAWGFVPEGEWTVTILPESEETLLTMEGGALCLHLANQDRQCLALPETEGVYFTAAGRRYCIEKDFPCAHPRSLAAQEPASETFAAPEGYGARRL